MKTIITILLLFGITSLCAQEADRFTNNVSDRPRDPRTDLMNFVPNEILVRFKDDVAISSGTQLKSAGVSSVDKVLKAAGGSTLEKLFPFEKKLKSAQYVKDPQGREMKIPSLHNIYKIVIPQTKSSGSMPADIFKVIEELKALPEVEYAEPNYIYSIDDLKPVGPILSASDLAGLKNEKLKRAEDAVVPNDPLYNQQWYIPAINADQVWNQTIGDTSQVIGILDTGVDWLHPDLINKIWINPGEISGNGIDDDGNGLIDDLRGWDYINNDNNPMDDNSHGTHVAGIAAAESNNGIGIAGVNWKAKIMPVKVFQSSGRGDAANIAMGIIYATQKGATVINMSFGSYARSIAMEDALANAYATAVLVAAAGNDAIAIEYECLGAPIFPAALSFVLGVQAPDGAFSNFDCNGPTFSNFPELFNYEMKAPGTNIISTVPNGNYRVYQGTSMAAPIIAGAVSLYRSIIPQEIETQEFMWVKLIQSTSQYLDNNKALSIVPKPEIWFLNNTMVDTLGTDDRDGRVDAGETIQLWFRARNTGGQVDSVYWKIRLAEFEDPATCTIIKPTSFLGSISPYATRTSENDPMVFKISPNVAHDRDITFDLLSWYKGASDTLIQKLVFTVENGEELKDVLDNTKILYPNKLYLVNNSFKIGENGTLIIKPGTHILFYPNKPIVVKGKLIAEGKPDSLIYFSGYSPPGSSDLVSTIFLFQNNNGIRYRFSFCKFDNLYCVLNYDPMPPSSPVSAFNCIFNVVNIGKVDSLVNNIFNSTRTWKYQPPPTDFPAIYSGGYIYKNNLIGPSTSKSYFYISNLEPVTERFATLRTPIFKYNNFVNLSMPSLGVTENNDQQMQNSWISEYSKLDRIGDGSDYKYNTVIYNKYKTCYDPYSISSDFQSMKYQYWGTSDSTKIEGFIYDFMENASYPRAIFKPYLTAPSDSCHAIVWKVLLNGKDVQDEKADPIGIGKQKIAVYFNRPMNKTITPQVAFGVRYPFNSNMANEEGAWSADGRIFTVYKTVKLFTGDGINRFRVTGAKDLEGWEIPLEDMRFDFLISAASSSSLAFMATPGLGKVKLEWNKNDLADGLGYNMYRMEHINDTTLTAPILINNTMITDTLCTDFSVVPNKKYYYYYKILRTNLAETDSSKVVSSIPLTASKGDANGDLTVNVLDITTLVSYLLNQNPQPFIFEAADVNLDGQVNVLDIIGVVKVISGGKKKISSTLATNPTPAYIYLKPDKIKLRSDEQVSALQFTLTGSKLKEVKLSSLLEGFEFAYFATDTTITGILFSYSGKTIPRGLQDILKIEAGSALLNWGDVTGGDNAGKYVTIIKSGEVVPVPSAFTMNAFPNPTSGEITISFDLPENAKVAVRIYNLYGQLISASEDAILSYGSHKVRWHAGTAGIYICRLRAVGEGENKQQYSKDIKLIVIK